MDWGQNARFSFRVWYSPLIKQPTLHLGDMMARPRRPFSGQETIVQCAPLWISVFPEMVGTRRGQRWSATSHLRYRTPNGTGDPVCFFHVLSSLFTIEDSIELRAGNLARHLNVYADNYLWDPMTVGKILCDLQEAFEDVLGRGNGLLQAGKDGRGTFYILARTRDSASLAFNVLDDLQGLAYLEVNLRGRGQKTDYALGVLTECPHARGSFEDLS